MFRVDFYLGDQRIGEATTERKIPGDGHTVVLEHPIHGPYRYRVVAQPDHWYTGKRGTLGGPDAYRGTVVRLYLEEVGPVGADEAAAAAVAEPRRPPGRRR